MATGFISLGFQSLSQVYISSRTGWQRAGDLCDVATLGSASRQADLLDLASLLRYPLILAVYDADPAGDEASQRLSSIARLETVLPPDHDLSDYFRSGGDLRHWIASQLAPRLSALIACLDPHLSSSLHESWTNLLRLIQSALPQSPPIQLSNP